MRELSGSLKDVTEAIGEGLADREHYLEHTDDNHEKEQRSPDAVEEDVVEFAAALGGERCAIAGLAADLRSPGMGTGSIAQHWKRELLCTCPVAAVSVGN